jgi:hypothetical protein
MEGGYPKDEEQEDENFLWRDSSLWGSNVSLRLLYSRGPLLQQNSKLSSSWVIINQVEKIETLLFS